MELSTWQGGGRGGAGMKREDRRKVEEGKVRKRLGMEGKIGNKKEGIAA